MIKLFAADLDGTLLNADHTSDAYISRGIQTLQQQGALFAVATGRNRIMIESASLPPVYYVCLNGAAIVDPEENVLFAQEIDKDILKTLYLEFADLPLEFNTIHDVFTAMPPSDDPDTLRPKNNPQAEIDFPKRLGKDFGNVDLMQAHRFHNQSLEQILAQPIVKINCLNNEDAAARRLQAFVQAHPDKLVNAPSYSWLFEITSPLAGKHLSLQRLAGMHNIQAEEVAVYGDGGNDIEMLSAFAHSYAPSTACTKAKAAASGIIGPYQTYSVIDHMLETARKDREE